MEVMDQYRLMIDVALWMLIWLVQLIIYPSFLHTDQKPFKAWHNSYTGRITIFVAPLMFSQTGIYTWQSFSRGRWDDWAGLALVTITWLCTFVLSVPCHDRMQREGYSQDVIQRLVTTNWPRTAAWNLVLLVDLWVFFT